MLKLCLGLVAAVAGVASTAARPSQSASMPAVGTLYGHWQVVGVAASDGGVQALASNDPSYMGRRLTFARTRLAWDKPRQTSTEGGCQSPVIKQTARDPDPASRTVVRKVGGPAVRAFSIACANGSWGPNASPAPAILAFRDGTIALWWYDGGLLKLRRVG